MSNENRIVFDCKVRITLGNSFGGWTKDDPDEYPGQQTASDQAEIVQHY